MSSSPSAFSKTLWNAICRSPDRTFWYGRETAFTYRDFAHNIQRVSRLLAQSSIVPGRRVIMMTDNDWHAACVWVGCVLNGVVAVMLPSDVGKDRAKHIAQISTPDLIISGTNPSQERLFAHVPASVITSNTLFDDASSRGNMLPTLVQPISGDAYVLFTSGSTSAPKGVVVTHDSLAAQLATLARVFRVDEKSRLFNGLVLHHVDGLLQGPILAAWRSATLIRPDPPTPDQLESDMTWLAAKRATHMIAAPALLELIDRSCSRDDYFNHPEFVAVLSSSAQLSATLWDKFENRFAVALINEYGMTETVAASHFAGPFPEMGARHTIGQPIDCKARIIDSDGGDAQPGRIGELQIKGKNLFDRYFADKDRTNAAFENGWFRTGDLARMDRAGNFEIIGRRDEAINYAGFLIQPSEIDEVIARLPAIREVKTIGLCDDVYGKVPGTVFVADQDIMPETVFEHCRRHLESRKVPKRLIQIDKVPKTATGKPDLTAIARCFEQAHTSIGTGLSLEQRLLVLAARVFGTSSDLLSPYSNADTTSGWDSYAHTTLILEIERECKVELPIAECMSIHSLGELVDLVKKALPQEDIGSPVKLRQIREGTGAGSLVCLPGISGQIAYIANLSRKITKSVSIHAMSFDADFAEQFADHTIQNLAHAYGDQILKAGLSEPLMLFGASFGGFLAYETSIVLDQKGCDIRAAILNDTAVPWTQRRYKNLRRIGLYARSMRSHVFKAPAYGGEPSAERVFVVPKFGQLNLEPLHERCHDVARHSFLALSKYQPSRANIPMLIFAAEYRSEGRIPMEQNLGWSKFNSGKTVTIPLGKDHFSVLGEVTTASIGAQHINAFFEQVGVDIAPNS